MHHSQRGVSLSGLIFVLVILAIVAVFGMKVFPTVSEYFSIKKAIIKAKSEGTTPKEIQSAFNKAAQIDNITAISGSDLEITQNNGQFEVSFAYEKKIPLGGPASLLLEYQGSTDNSLKKAK